MMWVVALAVGVIVATGLLFSASTAGPGEKTVTDPVHPPKASVLPHVAEEMNGPPGQVKQATKVQMHRPRPLDGRNLVGKGQGNGCAKGYGEPGQCLPLRSPAQVAMPDMNHPWTCPEVQRLFPDGIKVWETDRSKERDKLKLDTNQDGIACGPGEG